MDSVSQAALGAAVGVVVMGRRRPLWQAALAGAIVGTLPDLDVLLDKGDAVRDMVLHRAETHAYFWQLLASPLIAWLAAAATGSRELLLRWWLAVVLILVTHTLLDSLTIYGTRAWLPFSDYPVGLGSLFIIDPLYTLPLLAGLLLAGLLRTPERRRWAVAGLTVSTLYAGWSVAAQFYVTQKVMATPQAAGLSSDQVLVTPTPLNTVLWRIVLRHEQSYEEGFFSLLDPVVAPDRPIRFTRYDRGGDLEAQTADFTSANLVRHFSKGFYALDDDGRFVYITDLRMGQHPFYVFSFAVAEHQSEPLQAIEPRQLTRRLPTAGGLDWLRRRALGEDLPPPGHDAGEPQLSFTRMPGE
jgi:inner membrane protein